PLASPNKEVWSEKVGGPGFEPGASRSRIRRYSVQLAGSCGFQFEISDPAFLLVQKSVNLRPNYYMKYYTPLWANRRLHWPTVDRPDQCQRPRIYRKTREASHSPRF